MEIFKCNDCDKEFNRKTSYSNHIKYGCPNQKFIWTCPTCDEQHNYIKIDYNRIIKNNRKTCKKCWQTGKLKSEESKLKCSKTLKYKYSKGELIPNMNGAHSLESRKKQSLSKQGGSQSNESNIKRSISCKKANCGKSNKDKKHSNEFKRKCRLRFLEKLIKTNKKFHPPFNERACKYFDNLMNEKEIFIQHALNIGEFFIKELGYWVDGYDKENNVVYEYDEKRHFDIYGNLLEKDIIRQNEITNFLNCKFIRIKENKI